MKKGLGYINALKTNEGNAVININGVIGIPENWQFEDENDAISTKERLKAEVDQIENLQDVSKIIVNIDSPGGSVNHGKAIYTALKNSKATIFVNYTNDSASAATIIGAAAKKENVTIPDYCTLLVHEAWLPNASGTKKELLRHADTLEKLNKNIATIYSGQNNLSIEENLNLIGQDNGEGELLTAEKAKEFGFVGIIKQTEKMAAFEKTNFEKFYSKKQISNLNNYKMGLFSKKDKKTPLTITEIDGNNFAHKDLKEGENFEQVGLNEETNGTFIIENNSITVENSIIKEVAEIEAEKVQKNGEIQNLKEQLAEAKTERNELASKYQEVAEQNIDILDKLNKVFEESSEAKPPKSVIETQQNTNNELSAAAKARLRQAEKVSNKRKGGSE